jgi:hypothetical protein
MKPVSVTTSILTATVIGAALLAIGGLGFSSTPGENSKLVYNGNLWCVNNYIEEEDAQGNKVYLPNPDGRAKMDPRLKGKEDWIRIQQVQAESKEEAEQKATIQGWFEASEKVKLREALDQGDKEFFTTHFNTGATKPGPCVGGGTGDGTVGKWVNDGIREDCFELPQSSGNCEMKSGSVSLQSWGTVSLPKSGKIVKEDHLVTQEENFTPSNTKDRIENHYEITAKAIGKTYPHQTGWTPAEGGGQIGSGSSSRPPASAEPWIMNMYWSSKPPAGTKMIITNPQNGKSVVAAAGYETGPAGTKWLLGAQEEVLQAIGADTNTNVTVGFAQDQSLPFGPIKCTSGQKTETITEKATANTGSSTGGVCVGDNGVPEAWAKIFAAAGKKYNVNPAWLASIFAAEQGISSGTGSRVSVAPSSRWPSLNRSWGTSSAGAKGPMQIMDNTWSGCRADGNGDGVMDRQNVYDAIFSGARLIHQRTGNMSAKNPSDEMMRRSAISYNCGPNCGTLSPETIAYIAKTKKAFERYNCK